MLIVEDEPYMAEAIRDGLRLEAIAADIAGDGDSALELLSINAYDIAVLDRDIPGPSGDEIAERIVASGSGMPILMLTAADRLDDKASGFELGADDYLTKPFELRELVLRLRALDRRRGHNRPPVREIAGLRLGSVPPRGLPRRPLRRAHPQAVRCARSPRRGRRRCRQRRRTTGAGLGSRTQTRSPTPPASPSRRYANASANPGSSPPWPASATASAPNETPGRREETVDRAPGLSVRLKLTLSYAGFLMLAGALLLAAVWLFLLRYVPGRAFIVPGNTARPLFTVYLPSGAPSCTSSLRGRGSGGVPAGIRSRGGWLLAGRMLAPLAASPTPPARPRTDRSPIESGFPGRSDEFRELADAFDTMLARLEAHVAEQQRFAANASHELRTPLAITQTLLDVARNDPNHDKGELVDRLHVVNTRAIDLTEALLLLSRADQKSFTPEHVDLSLIAEEASETLLPFAEKHGVTIETSGDMTPTIGSEALLLQLTTNLVHNAIVHNLPEQGTVWVTTSALQTRQCSPSRTPARSSRIGFHAHRAVSARHRTHTHRPRRCRPRPRHRQKHHPSTRRNPYPHPPGRRRAWVMVQLPAAPPDSGS